VTPSACSAPGGSAPRRLALSLSFSLTLSLGSLAACSPASRPAAAATDGPASAATAGAATARAAAKPSTAAERTISLFFVTRLLNTPEPCGCASEPLGDVARLVALLKSSGASLLLDAGGLRYDDQPMDKEKLRQARSKADFLEQTWASLGAVTMLQPEDLRGGLDELRGTRRLVSNATGLPEGATVREVVREVGGLKIGVLGLADPEAGWPAGVQVGDPLVAATEAVARLRDQGAQVIVALTGMRRDKARRLLRKVPGIAAAVAGSDRELAEGTELAEVINDAVLLVPADKGQRAARLVLHLVPAAPGAKVAFRLHPTEAQQQKLAEAAAAQLKTVEKRLSELRKDASAEPAFVRTTEAEAERLRAEVARARTPSPPPALTAAAGYATAELVPIRRSLPRDPEVAKRMTALDRQIGEANLAALSGPPAPLPASQARYVGTDGCVGGCHFHDDAIEFWKNTRHGHAWKTLVDGGKDLSYDCVGCHATGFDLPGGSNLWTLAQWQRAQPPAQPAAKAGPDLRNVQCEVCHGPGSLHARAPNKNPVPVPRPVEARCLEGHSKEHSDTFQFSAYLRDILGPGHGAERRKELGDGPTGHELRSAALKKSGGGH
jgi:hypothetical protein